MSCVNKRVRQVQQTLIIMYIYNLPHQERRELCRILDQNDKWEELGGTFMKFDVMTLQDIRREILRGHSPTEELLTMWGHQNHTVLELFILLGRMKHYQSMIKLKPFVDSKYHKIIHEGEHNLTNLIQKLHVRNKNEPCTKDLGIPEHNFENSGKVLNGPVSCDNNNIIQVNNGGAAAVVDGAAAVVDGAAAVVDGAAAAFNGAAAAFNGAAATFNGAAAASPNMISNENNKSVQGDNNNLTDLVAKTKNVSNISESAGVIPQISYQELQAATNNWDNKTILGRGGFGIVFKGTWKCTLVAIKRIEQRGDNLENNNIQLKQQITEMHCLNAYRHDNVLPLYGYSINGLQPCLVYQYMSGGCLEQRLQLRKTSEKLLDWKKRLNIAKGTARGLQFLHTIGDKPLIHGDIKSANILLDQNDEAKIGDFGLAREGPQSDYTHMKVSRIHGTRPYLPDEFLRAKQISTKVDTYSFGVVLFEIATGLSAYSENRPNKFLKDHVVNFVGDFNELKDVKAGLENSTYFLNLIEIGKVCVSKRARDRPEMRNVLFNLESLV